MNSNKTPEDSTLRRHHETHLKMKDGSRDRTAARSAPGSSASNASAKSSSGGGGFMGWLKRLFGG